MFLKNISIQERGKTKPLFKVNPTSIEEKVSSLVVWVQILSMTEPGIFFSGRTVKMLRTFQPTF